MGAGLPSILRWLLWLLRPLWRPWNWGNFEPSFGPDSSFAKQDLAPVMERVNIRAPKSSTVAEHVRLLEKRATTGKAPPPPPSHHAHGRKTLCVQFRWSFPRYAARFLSGRRALARYGFWGWRYSPPARARLPARRTRPVQTRSRNTPLISA